MALKLRGCQSNCQSAGSDRAQPAGRAIQLLYGIKIRKFGAERGIRTLTSLRTTVFETAERVFVVVRRRSLEYGNRVRVGPSVRRRSPKFALTAVKLLSAKRPFA